MFGKKYKFKNQDSKEIAKEVFNKKKFTDELNITLNEVIHYLYHYKQGIQFVEDLEERIKKLEWQNDSTKNLSERMNGIAEEQAKISHFLENLEKKIEIIQEQQEKLSAAEVGEIVTKIIDKQQEKLSTAEVCEIIRDDCGDIESIRVVKKFTKFDNRVQ